VSKLDLYYDIAAKAVSTALWHRTSRNKTRNKIRSYPSTNLEAAWSGKSKTSVIMAGRQVYISRLVFDSPDIVTSRFVLMVLSFNSMLVLCYYFDYTECSSPSFSLQYHNSDQKFW